MCISSGRRQTDRYEIGILPRLRCEMECAWHMHKIGHLLFLCQYQSVEPPSRQARCVGSRTHACKVETIDGTHGILPCGEDTNALLVLFGTVECPFSLISAILYNKAALLPSTPASHTGALNNPRTSSPRMSRLGHFLYRSSSFRVSSPSPPLPCLISNPSVFVPFYFPLVLVPFFRDAAHPPSILGRLLPTDCLVLQIARSFTLRDSVSECRLILSLSLLVHLV